jgi:signal transduction histidine kinase
VEISDVFKLMTVGKMNKNKIETIRILAHDLNNTLAPIFGYTELALENVDSDSLAAKNLEKLYVVAKQARELVQEILEVSKD